MTKPTREVSSRATRVRRLALLAGLAILPVAAPTTPMAAQTIGVNAGATGSAIVAPGGKLAVPVIIDLTSAGAVNIASLQSGMSWGASQLTFDSLRVVPALGWTLFPNIGGAAGGSITFAADELRSRFPRRRPWPTRISPRARLPGGTRVLLTPTAGGNDAGADIIASLRARRSTCALRRRSSGAT